MLDFRCSMQKCKDNDDADKIRNQIDSENKLKALRDCANANKKANEKLEVNKSGAFVELKSSSNSNADLDLDPDQDGEVDSDIKSKDLLFHILNER